MIKRGSLKDLCSIFTVLITVSTGVKGLTTSLTAGHYAALFSFQTFTTKTLTTQMLWVFFCYIFFPIIQPSQKCKSSDIFQDNYAKKMKLSVTVTSLPLSVSINLDSLGPKSCRTTQLSAKVLTLSFTLFLLESETRPERE